MADNTVTMNKDDLEKMLKKLMGQTSTAGTSGPTAETKAFGDKLTEATQSMNPFSVGVTALGKVANITKDGFTMLETAITPNLNAFRELSKSGASFSNDIVGMVAAQKGMRLEMGDFSEIMKTNAANFTGLGGNVTRGAEAFAKLSSEFMDSKYIDGLKQAGFSNKELNDVLALQLTFQRSTYKDEKESRNESIDAASRLAQEMDMQAKLTGKSREEQMENMRKQKDDMQIEAKMRQIGLEKGPEAEAQARKEFAKQMNEAELRGTAQLFKESMLYGQAVSKEAAMQSITAGNSAFQAQVEQGRAFAKGEYLKASEMSAKASTEIIAFQKTSASNQIAMLPVQNELTASSHKLMKANQGLYDSLGKIQQEQEWKGKSEKEQYAEAQRRAQESARGKDAEGKDVSGATKAIINLGSRVEDVESAMYKKLVIPINEQVGPAINKLATATLSRTVIRPGQPDTTFAGAAGDEFTKGRRDANSPTEGAYDRRLREAPSPIVGGDILRSIGADATAASNVAAEGIKDLTKKIERRGRANGSLGATGNLFEDFGDGSIMMLHGKEAVVTEDQMKNLMKGIAGPAQALQQQAQTAAAKAASATKSGSVTDQISKMPMPSMGATTSTASLDDVVSSLNQLNMKMGQLLDTHEDLGSKQLRATKANSANLFAR